MFSAKPARESKAVLALHDKRYLLGLATVRSLGCSEIRFDLFADGFMAYMARVAWRCRVFRRPGVQTAPTGGATQKKTDYCVAWVYT